MSTDFESIIADFVRFVEKEGYPPRLFAVRCDQILIFRKRTYVLAVNQREALQRAKSIYEAAAQRGCGVAIEGIGRTATATAFHVLVPTDADDAERRLIPTTGVKMSVAVGAFPVVEVRNSILWWILGQLGGRQIDP